MPHFQPAAMPELVPKDFLSKNCVDFQLEEEEWDYSMNSSFATNSPASRSTDSFEQTFSPAQPIVAVIGCGYVGSHLAACFGKHFRVIALDVSEDRVRQLKEDKTYAEQVTFTTDASKVTEASHFLIAVPTGLKEDNTIDDSHLRAAIETVRKFARNGSTVVVESSVAVGMTRKLLQHLMESKNLKGGMSPEVSNLTKSPNCAE
jgi:UDP-N-acetyl-D-mannosaminuronate dehydrogenase